MGSPRGIALGLILAPSYTVVTSVFGTRVVRTDSGRLRRRLLVVPLAMAVLAAGTWLATARLPENGYTHYYRAVDHLEAGAYDLALSEADRATTLDPLMIEAYYVKARTRRGPGRQKGRPGRAAPSVQGGRRIGPRRFRAPKDGERRAQPS